MDGIFDRLGNLIKSFVQTDSEGADSLRTGDPDLDSAWEELDEYLKTGQSTSSGAASAHGESTYRASSGTSARGSQQRPRSQFGPPDELRQDYANLEVPFGAAFEAVRKSYKRLLIEYHPDKHGNNSQKQRMANEITKKINYSFQRIKRYHDTGSL